MTAEPLFIGIDAGLTDTKASIVDRSGRTLATASRHLEPSRPLPGWQERDLDDVFRTAAQAVAECVAAPDVNPAAIAGVGLCAHADGLYAIDAHGRPVRPAILASDSRALAYSERFRDGADAETALALTGQVPFPASQAALIPWLRDHEPASYASTRWYLACKDWIRFQLTGQISTDMTDASAAFLDVRAQSYSAQACELFGVPEVLDRLPAPVASDTVVGAVTAAAAELTGIPAGVPVVAGAHDVDAAALGMGAIDPGAYSMITGTFAINQVVADRPYPDSRWQARTFVRPGQRLHMATSPNSASNFAWIVRLLGPFDSSGRPDFPAAVAEAAGVDSARCPTFRPNVYGSQGDGSGGAFSGLTGDHSRAHLLRAVLEGIAFHHRSAIEALAQVLPGGDVVHLAGGLARSAAVRQLFADALGRTLLISGAPQVGVLGACVLAAVGTATFPSVDAAMRSMVEPWTRDENGGERVMPRPWAERDERFAAYRDLVGDTDRWGSGGGRR